jgi:hypothetical protein
MFAPKRSARSAAVRQHPPKIAGIVDGGVLSIPPKVWVARCTPGVCNVNQHRSRPPQASASIPPRPRVGLPRPIAAGRSRGFNSQAAAGQGRANRLYVRSALEPEKIKRKKSRNDQGWLLRGSVSRRDFLLCRLLFACFGFLGEILLHNVGDFSHYHRVQSR